MRDVRTIDDLLAAGDLLRAAMHDVDDALTAMQDDAEELVRHNQELHDDKRVLLREVAALQDQLAALGVSDDG